MQIRVTYRIRCTARQIEEKAAALAIEQSVEMPLEAIDCDRVLQEIVGEVEDIRESGEGDFLVRIALAASTAGEDAGQLINVLFGNSSLHHDVTLEDVEPPAELLNLYGGPKHGIAGLRERVGVWHRALSCAAVKPQGLPPARLAALTLSLSLGGMDYVKDDHALADQHYSPFKARIPACAAAVRQAAARTGHPTRYVPNLSGNLDQLRRQLRIVRDEGIDTVLVAPMLIGLPSFQTLRRETPDIAILAHPAHAGATGIAAPLLLGKLFRLFGADGVIFPHHGGRFGYSLDRCSELAAAARAPWAHISPALPIPAGGVTLDRLDEILKFYGTDTMVLIGGALLKAKDMLIQETRRFMDGLAQFETDRDRPSKRSAI